MLFMKRKNQGKQRVKRKSDKVYATITEKAVKVLQKEEGNTD